MRSKKLKPMNNLSRMAKLGRRKQSAPDIIQDVDSIPLGIATFHPQSPKPLNQKRKKAKQKIIHKKKKPILDDLADVLSDDGRPPKEKKLGANKINKIYIASPSPMTPSAPVTPLLSPMSSLSPTNSVIEFPSLTNPQTPKPQTAMFSRKASTGMIEGKPLISPNAPRIGKYLKVPMSDNLLYSVHFLRLVMRGTVLPTRAKLIKRSKRNLGEPEKKVLIIDMDQTIIYVISRRDKQNISINSSIRNVTKRKDTGFLQPPRAKKGPGFVCRPFLEKFLKNMSTFYDICIFSQSEREFIESVLHEIDPMRKYICDYLCKENMTPIRTDNTIDNNTNLKRVKAISAIPNVKKENCVILDPLLHAWPFDLDNLLPAEQYWGDTKDTFLPRISQFLIKLARSQDIQQQICHKCREIIEKRKKHARNWFN